MQGLSTLMSVALVMLFTCTVLCIPLDQYRNTNKRHLLFNRPSDYPELYNTEQNDLASRHVATEVEANGKVSSSGKTPEGTSTESNSYANILNKLVHMLTNRGDSYSQPQWDYEHGNDEYYQPPRTNPYYQPEVFDQEDAYDSSLLKRYRQYQRYQREETRSDLFPPILKEILRHIRTYGPIIANAVQYFG